VITTTVASSVQWTYTDTPNWTDQAVVATIKLNSPSFLLLQ
jgi:hypothetical protein